jgi:chromate transporter
MATNDPKPFTSMEVFMAFLKLGLTSFGGPTAHIGFFQIEFVESRKWLPQNHYADLVALSQFLPGPSSSQLGMSIGYSRAGLGGAAAAWAGFTLPSALAMILFGLCMDIIARNHWDLNGLHGLKVAAVAIVAKALTDMAPRLCPDPARIATAALGMGIVLMMPSISGQITAIALGGVLGLLMKSQVSKEDSVKTDRPLVRKGSGKKFSLICLASIPMLLIFLPVFSEWTSNQATSMFDSFFRTGSLVFGGGHVVLPLLQAELVPRGWVENEVFLTGYGAAQAVPGPMFTFAAFLGSVMKHTPNGWTGGILCLLAIFLPSFLFIIGAMPYWETLRERAVIRSALKGINASVVGLIAAAWISPVGTNGILSMMDLAIAATAFALLAFKKTPSWVVVLFCAGFGWMSQ